MAVGTEVGTIHIYQTPLNSPDRFEEILVLDQRCFAHHELLSQIYCLANTAICFRSAGHVEQVQRLAWRPSGRSDGGVFASADLATCSEDRSIRIVRIPFA